MPANETSNCADNLSAHEESAEYNSRFTKIIFDIPNRDITRESLVESVKNIVTSARDRLGSNCRSRIVTITHG